MLTTGKSPLPVPGIAVGHAHGQEARRLRVVAEQIAHAVRAAPAPLRRLRAGRGVGELQRVALVPRIRVHVVVGAVAVAAELQPALADAEVGRVVVAVGQLGRPALRAGEIEAPHVDLVGGAVPQQRREVTVGLGGDAAALEAGAEIDRRRHPIGGVEADGARVGRGGGPARVAEQRPAVGERRDVQGRHAQHAWRPRSGSCARRVSHPRAR